MRVKSNKGQVEISFNWIFILIAGAAILIFFTFIIVKETRGTEEKININLQKRMEALLSAVEKNPASIKNIGYFTTELKFSCEQGSHEFYAEGSSSRSELQSELIYAPNRLGKSDVIAWTVPLKAPYKVSNLLLLSDEKTMYVFENNIHYSVLNAFPSQFSSKRLSRTLISSMNDEGHERYVIVLSNSLSGFTLNSPSLKEKGKTTVLVLPQNQDLTVKFPKGTIYYYEYTNGVNGGLNEIGFSQFVTLPLLFGSIISASPSLYSCSTDKLIKRIRSTDELNLLRVEKLRDYYSTNYPTGSQAICSIFYSSIKDYITEKKDDLENFYTPTGISNIQNEMINILTADEQLLTYSCPQIGVYEGTRTGSTYQQNSITS